MNQTLLAAVTQLALLVIEFLRGRHRRHIVSAILNPASQTPADVRRMIDELVQGESQLNREIAESAARALGLAVPRLPLSAYATPYPRSWPELRRRLWLYQLRLETFERCVQRRAARLRNQLGLSPLNSARRSVQVRLIQLAFAVLHGAAPRVDYRAHPAIHPP